MALMYPRVADERFDIVHDHIAGTVVRRESYNPSLDRVVVEFHQPLDEKPAVRNEYVKH